MDNNNNYQAQNYNQINPQAQNYNQYNSQPYIPPEYQPISMWGYFGYELLFAIPVIGFILLIVFCFAPANKNVKNFARSYFCLFFVALIILVICAVLAGGFGTIFAARVS